MTKRITALFLTLVTLLSCIAVPANAASTLEEAMAEVNVYARNDDLDWLRVNGAVKTQHYTYYLYRSEQAGQTKEIPAYCTDPRLYGVPALVPEGNSIKYGADGTVTDPKIMGICANGYPHIDLDTLGLSSVEEAYYATKTALWCYLLSTWSIDSLSVNPNADQAAAQRVLQATRNIYNRGMQWDKLVEPKLTATPDRDTAYAATVGGESVYQQIFTVTSETWSYEPVVLSLASGAPSGTKILDMDNNEVSRLSSTDATRGDDGYSWQVKVVYPASAVAGEDGTVQLNMSAVVVQYELFHAKCLETDTYGNAQSYVLDTDPHTPIAASAISTYSSAAPSENPTPSTGETAIKIRKLEKGTNTPLAGAVFEVKHPDGSTVGSFSTGSDGTITIPVTVTGNYTVTETASAKNHLLPDVRTQSVTVTHGNTATVTFTNAPYGGIRVEKVSDTGEKLGGVSVQIKHIATGATQSAKTNSAGVAEFLQLPIGGYEVRETAGIEGWQFDGDTVKTVTVTTGETSTVTFTNKELPGLRIVKYDRTTLQTLSDVTFEIFKDGVSIGRFTTDAMGEIVLTNASPGTYLVKEIQSVDSHITDTTPQEIELKAGDGIRQLVFYNDLKPGIHLVKVDSADLSEPIANAKFSIRAVDGSYGPTEFTTGVDGSIDLSRLPTSAYVVTELSCPGYVIDDAQRIIQLDGNENAEFVFTNSIRPTIHIVKLSSDGTPLPGVAFRITRIADGASYLDRVTDQNGEITISNLDPGVYSVRETATTADHVLDLREFHVELFAGKTSTLVVENQKRPNLIVYKYDADTGEPIADTVFSVRAADGHSVDEIRTDRNGRATLANLLPGVYEITEKAVPNDWLLDAPSELVTLYANRDHTAYFYNHKKPSITVSKVSSVTGDLLEGAKFHVEYASNNTTTGERNDLGYFYTGEDGTFTLTHQRDGWYKITEVDPPTGYAISEEQQEFYLAAGKNKTVTFEDVPLSALVVYKFDSVTGEAVKDAVFQLRYLTDTSGTGGTVIGRYTTSANGSFTVTGLVKGAYIVEELASDSAHVIDTAPQTAFLSGEDQDVVQLYFGNVPKGSVLIRKIDSITHAPLSGVQFYITDSTGAALGNANGYFTTDSSGSILLDSLSPSVSVIAKEARTISGYILDDAPQTVKVKPGETVSMEFLNQPKGNLIIRKFDSVTKQPLPGAEFKVTTANGELTPDNEGLTSSNGLYLTDENGQITLSKLTPATYVISETKAPDGYALDNQTQTVVVGAADTQTISFYDEPLATLMLLKRDAVSKLPLANAEFTVKTADGTALGTNNGLFTTDDTGTATVTGIQPNTAVVVSEDSAPAGYVANSTPKTIVVKSGVPNRLTFDNEPTTTLVIHKYIEGTNNEPLAGVGFRVTDSTGAAVGPNNGTYYTDHAGEIMLTGLAPGITVTAQEFKTVDGYVLDGTPQSVLIKDYQKMELTFWNAKAQSLTINKYVAGTTDPIQGVRFQVTASDGKVVGSSNGEFLTDENGEIVLTDLTPGTTITAHEIETVSGFVLDTTPKSIKIESGEAQSLVFYNQRKGGIIIEKQDEQTGAPLSGAEFKVTTIDGKPVDDNEGKTSTQGLYVTDENGQITLLNLQPDTYVIAETKAPKGYVLDSTEKSVKVNENDTQTVKFTNTALQSVTIQKFVEGSNTPLAGVTFLITDGSGAPISGNGEFKTDSNGRIVLSGLIPGTTLIVKEIKTAKGYVLNTQPQTIVVGKTNSVTSVSTVATTGSTTSTVTAQSGSGNTLTFYDDPLSTLIINKFVTGTTRPIKGVRFLITDSTGAYVGANNGEHTTDANGQIVLKNLEPGISVTAKEIEAAEGYVLDGTPKSIEIKTGEVLRLDFYNSPEGGLELIKVNASDKTKRIENVIFEIRRMDGGLVETVTTGKNGRVHVNLDAGSYYAVEIAAAKGYKLDNTPQYFEIKDGRTTTLTVANTPYSGIEIHKVDSVTGEGIYNAKFLLYDAEKHPVGEYVSDQNGYVYVNDLTRDGKYFIRELECEGYNVDTQMKTITLKAGEIIQIEWKNDPITGQIQVYKYAAEYNAVTGTVAGAPLSGAVYEIVDVRSGKVVDNITTDARGMAASKALPLKRYQVKEVTAPAYWQVDSAVHDVTLEFSGQIIKLSAYDKPAELGVSITKRGNASVMAEQQMKYTITVANTSNVALENFFWHERIPTDVATGTVLTTGTYSARLNYRVLYKTNYNGNYQVLASDLLTSNNYSFALNAIPMQAGEVVTDIYFDFGKVPVGFQSVTAPTLSVQVSGIAANGYTMVNRADVGGKYGGAWQTANASWATAIIRLGKTPTLPKTGY